MTSISDLSHLRSLIALAEELHFGRAAARLNISQPPLSRHIQLLEHQVGVPLVARSSRRVAFTAAGERFVAEARLILAHLDGAAALARRVSAGTEGVVRIGFTAASSYSLLPRLIATARQRLPGVVLDLQELVSEAQLDALATDRIDVGLLRPPVDRALRPTLVAQEPLVIALPIGDARITQDCVRLRDLHGLPFVAYTQREARYFDRLLDRLFEPDQVAPMVVHRVAQIHTMLAFVGGGLGAALVPESASAIAFPGVTFRPIETIPAKPVALFAVSSDRAPPAAQSLLEILLD